MFQLFHARELLAGPKGDLKVSFGAPLAFVAVVLIICFGLFTKYTEEDANDEHVNQYYMYYIHVILMVFVGFGWLMTFLRRYSFSAVALNMLTSAVVMLEFILVGGAVQQLWHEDGSTHVERIHVDFPLLIDAAFCAASAMIAFGAVIGRVNPNQIMLLLILMVPIYAVNQKLVFEILKGLDTGGSMTIHAFGAYFGLVASLVLSKPGSGSEHPKFRSCYASDMTAMVGTIFLWIFWPSFNAALTSNPDLEELPVQTQFYAVVNTIVSLLGATLTTFAASALLEGKLNMVHIQNATLAGGVGVGSAAHLKIMPAGALAIGMVAGLISTSGYVFAMPFLERKIGLKDTCGVHNLHGMPGILGGLAALLGSVIAYDENKLALVHNHGNKTWQYQLASIAVTLGMALVGGLVCSWLVALTTPNKQVLNGNQVYEDAVVWSGAPVEEWEGCDMDPSRSVRSNAYRTVLNDVSVRSIQSNPVRNHIHTDSAVMHVNAMHN